MKATVEIIPHPNPWRNINICIAGVVTGVAGTIGAMLMKEKLEDDGCVILGRRYKINVDDLDAAAEDAEGNSTPATEARQHGAAAPGTPNSDGDHSGNLGV